MSHDNELSDSLKSLIYKIDSALGNAQSLSLDFPTSITENSYQPPFNEVNSILREELMGEPAAFEEVNNNIDFPSSSTPECLITKTSTILEANDEDLSSYLEKLSHVKTFYELSDNQKDHELKVSDISSLATDTDDQFSEISSECIKNLPVNSLPIMFPYNKIPGSPFHLFDVDMLDKATHYSHHFQSSGRKAAYYGEQPYSYGKTHHSPNPFSENKYLEKILNYIDIVIPGIQYNSAMVHKYEDGEAFMPFHADNEEEIAGESLIITISLGETRFIEFKNSASGSIVRQKLCHGDVFVMDKKSQSHYTHSIPPDHSGILSSRLSVTLRQIQGIKDTVLYSPLSPASVLSPTTTVSSFLYNLQDVDSPAVAPLPKPLLAELTLSPDNEDPLEPELPEDQPKLMDQIHPSRRTTFTNVAEPVQSKPPEETLFISSSMFRNIDTDRLSSEDQNATKLFYPGANAAAMLQRIKSDPEYKMIQKGKISKIFILTGSNNIDAIYSQIHNASTTNAFSDIRRLLEFLKTVFPNAVINVLNILPRKSPERCNIIRHLNSDIERFCRQSDRFEFINTYNNFMFSNSNGSRRNMFFMPANQYHVDNVHLNANGVVRLGKHLKFLSHQTQ